MSKSTRAVYEAVYGSRKPITRPEIRAATGLADVTVKNALTSMRTKGYIRADGRSRGATWVPCGGYVEISDADKGKHPNSVAARLRCAEARRNGLEPTIGNWQADSLAAALGYPARA